MEQVSDTVRHEEARIDRDGKVNIQGSDEVIDDAKDWTDR
jgi:stress response protein YsnF